MVEPVNMLVWQAVDNVSRLDLSLKMVTTREAHGRVSMYYRNSIELIRLKKPRFGGVFFKVQDRFSAMLKIRPIPVKSGAFISYFCIIILH